MIELKDDQQKKFDVWLSRYIKESGHDFMFGFYVILNESDEMIHRQSPEYIEWYENKKQEFLIEENGK